MLQTNGTPEMKETIRRQAETSSWRGSHEDFRTDVDFAHRLVARCAPEDDTKLHSTIELGDRSRSYASLKALIDDLGNLDVTTVSEIEAYISNATVWLTLTLTPRAGARVEVGGNPVDVEGVRSEMHHHLARRESAPSWVRSFVPKVQGVGVVAALLSGQLWAMEQTSTFRGIFLGTVLLVALASAAGLILSRGYPRLEFVAAGKSRSSGLKKGLIAVARYVGAAVLGALADHLIR
jgi:hypothetical protein